jgi:hypothetical protein
MLDRAEAQARPISLDNQLPANFPQRVQRPAIA